MEGQELSKRLQICLSWGVVKVERRAKNHLGGILNNNLLL